MIKVGISCRVTEEQAYSELRNSLALDWVTFCEKLQLIPVLIPNGLTNVGKYCSELALDAVILSGGNNVSPKRYQSEEELDDVYDIRDQTESDIIFYCTDNDIPLIGVCRGMFMINIFFEGSLTHGVLGHVGITHPVKFHAYTNFFSAEKSVNSYHNQAIFPSNLSKNLIPFAYANDGTIEAFKHCSHRVFGLLWHPEREPHDEETQNFIHTILTRGELV